MCLSTLRMKNTTVIILSFIMFLVGCSKAPDYVISENDMVSLMADMYKAEAMIEDNTENFNNDTMKMKVRQSVMMKHGVTQETLDTSLIWYSHNLDVYDKVYDKVIKRLDNEYRELSKGDFTSVAAELKGDLKPSVPRFRNVGDTADIWGKSRTWILLPGFADNIISFDMKPDKENMQGDRYELAFKLNNVRRTMKVFLGVDYKDGSTAYLQRSLTGDGWKYHKLQADSLREVKRIYGYITYKSQSKHAVYVDSVELLRTHLDRNTYGNIMKQQQWVGQKEKTDGKEKKDDAKEQSLAVKNDVKVHADKKITPITEEKTLSPVRRKRLSDIRNKRGKDTLNMVK